MSLPPYCEEEGTALDSQVTTAARTLTCIDNIYPAELNTAALLPNSVITTEQLWLNMGLCGGVMFLMN